MFHSTHSIEKMVEERARLTKLEGENALLQRKLKENKLSHKKIIKFKDADISFLNKEISDQEEVLKVLNEKFKLKKLKCPT